MSLASVKGQARAVEGLLAALRAKTVHHAYLLTGPDGVGKELAAIGFAQALFCTARPGEGCGECSACQRLVRRNHPDALWVMPEAESVERGFTTRADYAGTPSRDIKVEQVRALQERLSLRALEGRAKVALLLSAHKLNPQAQNALLKSLEEPPPDSHLVLIASAPDRLLPTLRSRCSRVEFAPLPRAVISEVVRQRRDLDPTTADLLAALSGGSLGQALALDVSALKRRGELLARFEALTAADGRTALRLAEAFGGSREEAEDALALLSVWLRDVAARKAGGTELVNRDLSDRVEQSVGRYSPAALQRRSELVAEAREALERNGSPRLQLERMLIRMAVEAGARP